MKRETKDDNDFSAQENDASDVELNFVGAVCERDPYPGLRSFRDDENELFFGREGQIESLGRKLTTHRFVAVVGPSGCGKSSLVQAGLLSELKMGFIPNAEGNWRLVIMRPGARPLAGLAASLTKKEEHQEDRELSPEQVREIGLLYARLRLGSLGLIDALKDQPLPPDTRLLILVDQFEEIFRYRHKSHVDEADAFVALLLKSLDYSHQQPEAFPIYVVLTMRSDYIGCCDQFAGLPEAINTSQFLTPRMTRDQRRGAIVGPARHVGGQIELELVNRLLNDMGDDPDQLPIMQHALMQMWSIQKEWVDSPQDICLGVEDYERAGGWKKTLSNHADAAFEELDDDGKLIAERLFRGLTEPGPDGHGVRRPVGIDEVAAVAHVSVEQVRRVTAAFQRRNRNFLTLRPSPERDGMEMIDISHESLIRQWDRLREWVLREKRSAEEYTRLEERALAKQKRLDKYLEPPALDIALQWFDDECPSAVWASRYGDHFGDMMQFLKESRAAWDQQEDRRRKREEREIQRSVAFEAEKARADEAAARKEEAVQHARSLSKKNRLLALMSVVAVIASVAAAFFMIKALDDRKTATERLSDLHVAEGTRLLGQGDVAKSLFWFAENLANADENGNRNAVSVNRLRLAAGVRQLPRLAKVIAFKPQGGQPGPTDASIVRWRETDSKDKVVELAVAYDKSAHVWNLSADKKVAQLPVKSGVKQVALSPYGRYLATANTGLQLWDLIQVRSHSGKVAPVFQIDDTKINGKVVELLFQPFADPLAVEQEYRLVLLVEEALEPAEEEDSASGRGLRLVSWRSGQQPQVDDLPFEGVARHAAFSDTGRFLAIGLQDTDSMDAGRIQVWNLSTIQLDWETSVAGVPAYVQFSPDASYLLAVANSATGDAGRISYWERQVEIRELVNDDKPWFATPDVRGMIEHKQPVRMASFSPDSRHIVSASEDTTARLRDLGVQAADDKFLRHGSDVFWASFSPDARYVVTGSRDRSARVWDVASGELALPRIHHSGTVGRVLFNPEGDRIITLSEDVVSIWTMDTGNQQEEVLPVHGNVRHAAASFDLSRIVTASELTDGTGALQVWKVSSDEPVSSVAIKHARPFRLVAFNALGDQIGAVDDEGVVRIWRVRDREVLFDEKPALDVRHLAFAPSGSKFLIAGASSNGKKGATLIGGSKIRMDEDAPVLYAAFSPDAQYIVTAGGKAESSGYARIYRASDGREVASCSHGGAVLHAEFAQRDGRRFLLTACDDNRVRVWNWAEGEAPFEFPIQTGATGRIHTADVVHASFDSTARYVVSASKDQKAKIWSLDPSDTLSAVHVLEHDSAVEHAAFSQDGTLVITSAFDDTVRLWDRDSGELITAVRHAGHVGSVGIIEGHVIRSISFPYLAAGAAPTDRADERPRLGVEIRNCDFSPFEYSIKEFQEFSRLLSAQSLEQTTSTAVGKSRRNRVLRLGPADLETKWQLLAKKWEAHSNRSLPPSRIARRCEAKGQLFAAIWHWGTEAAPPDELVDRWLDDLTISRPRRAIREFTKQINKQAGDRRWQLHFRRGQAIERHGSYEYLDENQYLDAAIDDYNQALNLLQAESQRHGSPAELAMLHRARGSAYVRKHEWTPAVADFARIVEIDPANVSEFRALSLMYLKVGDVAGHHRTCRQLLQRFGATDDIRVASDAAWTCLLEPTFFSDENREQLHKLAAVCESSVLDGALRFRAADLEGASKLLASSEKDSVRQIDNAIRKCLLAKILEQLEDPSAADLQSEADLERRKVPSGYAAGVWDELELEQWFEET